MKTALSLITLATMLAATPAFARPIDELDRLPDGSSLTQRVIDHSIEPVVRDHQADHDPLSGIMILISGNPIAQQNLENKVQRNMHALHQHCSTHRTFHLLSTMECGLNSR